MNLSQVEIFNAGALENIPGLDEQVLVRVPEAVRNCMNERARFVGMDSVGCEVRFVTAAPNVDVYVSCTRPEFAARGMIRVFKGDFEQQNIEVDPGRMTNLRLNRPPAFDATKTEALNSGGFAASVWRLAMDRGATFCVHHIDTHGHDIRPPAKSETPALTWLAYGSSITNSSLDGYPHVASRILRIPVLNKGLSGACHLEQEMIDWLVDECQWDLATIEMGINMRGCFTPEEFEQRAAYAIKRFAATGRPVLITDLFPNGRTAGYSNDEEALETVREKAFSATAARLVREQAAKNLHFVPAYEILNDFAGLSADLLHPSAFGHAIMGANLARQIKEKLLK